MHQSSLDKMQAFVRDHLDGRRGTSLRVLDLGSMNVNGCYRPLFDDPAWHYCGVDLHAGPNVDQVLSDPYRWPEIRAASQDIVISGQAFEHIEYFWVTLQRIAYVLRPGGLVCIVAPSRGYEHRYPVDCWRFYPDAFHSLSRYVGLELLSSETQWGRLGYTEDDSDDWGDTMAVLRKPNHIPWRTRLILALRLRIDSLLLNKT